VRCAFWLVFRLLNAGDLPSASGWIARIERLLCDTGDDSPERGHVTYLTGFQAILSRDLQTAEADLGRSVQIAERGGDLELSALARLALGRVLIFRGDVSGGVRLLDEAMVAVNAGEVSPIVVGDSYCAAIESLVRYATGPCAVRRALFGASLRVLAAEGCLGRSDGYGGPCPQAAVVTGRPARGRCRHLPAGRVAPAARPV
jgi:hypothetical protein